MSATPDCYRKGSLIQRTTIFPTPPKEFDLVTACPEELARYGIPPKPNPEEQPELYRSWMTIFGRPVVIVPPKPEEVLAPFQLNPLPPRPPSAAGTSVSRFEKSANWSGAYVVPTDDTMFVLIAGKWTLPTIQLPPPEHQSPTAKQYVCSTWVGLDGQRRYLNSSLPQIGVMQTLTLSSSNPPAASAQGFFQWWDRDHQCHTFLLFLGLPVQAGDMMIGAIWADTPTHVFGYLLNVTTLQLAIVAADSPTVVRPGSAPFQLEVSGATAEWVFERPTIVCSADLEAFPAYSTTTFECAAWTAPAAGLPQSFHDLRTARFIRMYDTMFNPTRTEFISMPTRVGDDAVQLDYGDFKD